MEEELQREQVWNVTEFMNALYSDLQGYGYDYYNSQLENKNLIDLNNNPQVPTYARLIQAISNYKDSASLLQKFSEYMKVWSDVYRKLLTYKKSLLSYDYYFYLPNATKEILNSQEYKEDKRRVEKFFQRFNFKQEADKITENMLISDQYFVWLRDNSGSFDDNPIDLSEDNYKITRTQYFGLQMMPQNRCKITGYNTVTKSPLWDFDLNYFNQGNVNITNYDPSLREAFNKKKQNGQLKSFINNNVDLNSSNGYGYDGWYRTKIDDGAFCFKYDQSNFNAVPPFAGLLKTLFNDDVVAKMQIDKDFMTINAIITGEMKTKKDEKIGSDKNAFTIDPKQVGQLLQLCKRVVDKHIKPLAMPLEEVRMWQYNDTNTSMAKNQYVTSARQGVSAYSMVYASEKMSQLEMESALNSDYQDIAKRVYPQLENFLNYYVNKKTRKYKFKFKVKGSTLPFIRDKEIENHMKYSDKGMQVSVGRWGSLLGYEPDEFESMLIESKYGGLQDELFLLMNSNTSKDGSTVGNPTKETVDLKEGGSVSRDY